MTNAFILHPDVHGQAVRRDPQARLAEACGLAEAIDLRIVGAEVIAVRKLVPATFFGSGKVAELAERLDDLHVDLLVFDGTLTPIQQRNLEKGLGCKVIDRTALILEIFGERAQTKEGVLQVELAALDYQKSRLVRSWTHLERQRGGGGFMGGPGEKQIESDRRIINDKITQIKKQLGKVKNTRGIQRKSRQAVPYPVVALVGYTNAGKSTLFNRLTGAAVMAEDMLFATLDPTMRLLRLPSGREVILSDTVGFISELPTQLVAAFHATLEEVIAADVIVHVRDIASVDSDEQKQDVLDVLGELMPDATLEDRLMEVQNKVDLADGEVDYAHGISALTGDGCEELLEAIDAFLAAHEEVHEFTLPASDGAKIAWLHAHGTVKNQTANDDSITLTVEISPANAKRFSSL